MEMEAAPTSGKILVKSYSPGQFEIGKEVYRCSIFLYENTVFKLDSSTTEELTKAMLTKLFDAQSKVDVFLIGWGTHQGRLNTHLNNALEMAGIGVDIMNTGAACRTYNVLALDEREVAAVLLAL